MNGTRCSFEGLSLLSLKEWILGVWRFYIEDKSRVLFSFKVGLAVLLVSLLILIPAPYEMFGDNIIWSIVTAAIMFEYTVGATFCRGFNRALGSLLAVILAIAIAELASESGRVGRVAEPIMIGTSIFFIGAITSLLKQWPSLVPYEYGFRVILFTYCLIIVSGYRMGNSIRIYLDRLYSVAIGGVVSVLVNVLVFPIWAGEQLHQELVKNFNSVADSLEECVKKYLEDDGLNHPEFSTTVIDEFPDEPAYKKCKLTLSSSTELENLANAAKWEPPHGSFRHFSNPWSEYVKVNTVLRYCAHEVMALYGVLHSEIQAPYNLRIRFQKEIQDATSEAAELVRCLGKDISKKQRSLKNNYLLKKVHTLTEHLQHTVNMHSFLLTSTFEPQDNPTEQMSKNISHTLSSTLDESLKQMAEFDNEPHTLIPFQSQTEAYNEMSRNQSRRRYSWPSKEVDDAFDQERSCVINFVPKMKALESTAALSLATFTSLLIEFVARLNHLVEAVDNLARIAKFKYEGSMVEEEITYLDHRR